MTGKHGRVSGSPPKPPYLAAACAGAGVFLLYALTLAPAPAWWDTSEYIATAYTMGLPHPPGNPLFVVVGRAWSILLAPLGLSPAVRINLLAAATSAGASFFFFLIAHRALVRLRGAGREALIGAGVAVVVSATAFTVWSQSNANEKVYTISLLIAAAVSWLMVRWRDRRHDPRSVTLVVFAVYLMALGATNHLMSVLPAGAVLVFICLTRPRLLVHPRFLSWCGAAVVIGLSFNFVLPIRAARAPRDQRGGSVVRRGGGGRRGDLHQRGRGMPCAGRVAQARPVRESPGHDPHGAVFPPAAQLLPVLRLAVVAGTGPGRASEPQPPPLQSAVPRPGRGRLLHRLARRPQYGRLLRGLRGHVVGGARLLPELPFWVLARAGSDRRAHPRGPGARLLLPALLRAVGGHGGAWGWRGAGSGWATAWGVSAMRRRCWPSRRSRSS